MVAVREAAVAGVFYPADPARLRADVEAMLAEARGRAAGARDGPLAGLVVPHAGYRFSGPTAADGYALIDPADFDRVLLLGPTHRVGLRGIAHHGADSFATPLGETRVAGDLALRALRHEAVVVAPHVHADEHSLEVHLPFLKTVLPDAPVLPLAVGDVRPSTVAELIADLADDPRTLVVVSSDLSHFERADAARAHDAATIARILDRDATLGPRDACGVRPLNGLLTHAAAAGWRLALVSACNSGDRPDGGPDRVVGYATLSVHRAERPAPARDHDPARDPAPDEEPA